MYSLFCLIVVVEFGFIHTVVVIVIYATMTGRKAVLASVIISADLPCQLLISLSKISLIKKHAKNITYTQSCTLKHNTNYYFDQIPKHTKSLRMRTPCLWATFLKVSHLLSALKSLAMSWITWALPSSTAAFAAKMHITLKGEKAIKLFFL